MTPIITYDINGNNVISNNEIIGCFRLNEEEITRLRMELSQLKAQFNLLLNALDEASEYKSINYKQYGC